jgi:hypothetical protein
MLAPHKCFQSTKGEQVLRLLNRTFAGLAMVVISVFELGAAPIVAVQSGGIVIGSSNLTTAGTQAAPWTISETMSAAGVLVLSDTDQIPLQSPSTIPDFTSGNWFSKTVTNNSGAAWTSFELELQEILGTPSSEGDGLSFAQGAGLTFASNVFTTYTRIDITRDYLNFSGGTVAPGASVTFNFAVTDNSPISPIYLAQTPNKVDTILPEPATFGLLGPVLLAGIWLTRRKRESD